MNRKKNLPKNGNAYGIRSFALARIFHTDRDEEAAKAGGARRAMKSNDICACTHCPRKISRSTQHPSCFPAYAGDRCKICGLTRILHTDRDEEAAKADGTRNSKNKKVL